MTERLAWKCRGCGQVNSAPAAGWEGAVPTCGRCDTRRTPEGDRGPIDAAVNALPSLLDRLEAAEAVVEAAREVLAEPHAYIGGRERAIIDAALRRHGEVSR